MKINEFAKLTGVTVRTLHYYDEIGLLKPSKITESGYRIYDNSKLELLQQILFFRELDFSLNDIKEIMSNPNYDKTEALTKQKELLIQRKNRLDELIKSIDSTLKGENNMNFKVFDTSEIEENKKRYAEEVKERWGRTSAYSESKEKTGSYDEMQWKAISGEGDLILEEFAECRQLPPTSEKAQSLVRKWQNYISANFYNCTDEILACLGLMYVEDERFTANINRKGKGTAEFMAEAIRGYCGG